MEQEVFTYAAAAVICGVAAAAWGSVSLATNAVLFGALAFALAVLRSEGQ